MKGRAIEDRWTRWDAATGQRVPNADHGQGSRWRARFIHPDGREQARRFATKAAASAWLDEQSAGMVRGDFIDARRGRVLFAEWAPLWLAGKRDLKASTSDRYERILRVHLLPRFGPLPLGDITHGDVAAFVAGLSAEPRPLAPSTVRQTHRVLSLILAFAVRDGRLQRNSADGVPLPRTVASEKRFLTATDLRTLAGAASERSGPESGLAILVLGLCGIRFGELSGLRVRRVDLLRRRFDIAEAATEVAGEIVLGTPKTHQRRSVPIPRSLIDPLAALIAGREPDDFVFTSPRGGPLRLVNWRRRIFDPAARASGLDGLTPHELRHTAASLAVASGANVKAVQRMLGHASAAVTLDIYSGLFDDDLDGLADRMDAAFTATPPPTDAAVSTLRL